MEQNSEDSQATKRSDEIHSGEVKRDRVSSAQAARKAELFCAISFINNSTKKPTQKKSELALFISLIIIMQRRTRSEIQTEHHPDDQHDRPDNQEDDRVREHDRNQCPDAHLLVVFLCKRDDDREIRHQRRYDVRR